MESLASLPPWALVVLAVLAAVVLVALNIGWLLQAKAMLDGMRGKDRPGQDTHRRQDQ